MLGFHISFKTLSNILRYIIIGGFFVLLFIKPAFSQCKFGFDMTINNIPVNGPVCLNSDSIELTAWDTTETGGCVIEPGFFFDVKLDFDSEKMIHRSFYKNGKFVATFDFLSDPLKFQNNRLLGIFADYRKPTDVWTAVFCRQ